jgi:hypothetical protein
VGICVSFTKNKQCIYFLLRAEAETALTTLPARELCRRTRQVADGARTSDRFLPSVLTVFCWSMAPYASMLDTAGVSFARAQPFRAATAVCDRVADVTMSVDTPTF